MGTNRDVREGHASARGAEGPLNLIHRTNSPKQATARVSGRLACSIRDPQGIPLDEVFRVISGDLAPLEFLVMRRAANATKSTR